MSFRRRALFLAGLFVAVSCSDAGNPIGPEEPGPVVPRPEEVLTALQCTVYPDRPDMECAQPTPRVGSASGIFVGGTNGDFVRLTKIGHNVDADSMWFNLTLQNLIGQTLGVDSLGVVDPAGIRIFFETEPSLSGPGLIEVVADSTAFFFDPMQPYFQYTGVLVDSAVSSPSLWKFKYKVNETTPGAMAGAGPFTFTVLVAAKVPHPKGWLEIIPQNPVVQSGGVDSLLARVRNQFGQGLPDGVDWTSSNTGIVTVTELTDSTAEIAGVAEGTAYVKAVSATDGVRRDSVLVTVNNAPVVQPDSISALENVTDSLPAPRLQNNVSEPGATVVPGTSATFAGGQAIVTPGGGLVYRAPAGFSGKDTVTYQVTDGTWTVPAKVVVQVEPSRYWYVRAGAAGDGRDRSPFGTIAAAQAVATVADSIFVLAPANGTSPVDGPAVLQNSQSLIGQGVTFDVTRTLNGQSVMVFDGTGAAPGLTRTAAGPTVTVAQNNIIRGVAIDADAGAALFSAAPFGTLFIRETDVAPTGPALDLTTGTIDAVFGTLSALGSASTGIRLTGVNGSVTATAGAISITGAGGAAVSITGGVSVSYPGNVTQATNNPLLAIANHTGTLAFGGTLQASTGTGAQFSNASGTYTFTGAVTLSNMTGGFAGIDVRGGSTGTFSFPAGSSVANTSGPALYVGASAPTLTYAGTLSNNNNNAGISRPLYVDGITGGTVTLSGAVSNTGAGILVEDNTGGVVEVSGNVDVSGNAGGGILVQENHNGADIRFTGASKHIHSTANITGVYLLNNTGAVITFGGGGLNLDMPAASGGTANGFVAQGGGTVTVTGPNNVVNVGEIAVRVASTTIGAAGINLRSVTSTVGLATHAVSLTSTGAGGLQITGAGAVAGSGGSITGADSAFVLSNVGGPVEVAYVNASGTMGVFANTFNLLTLTGTSLTSAGGPVLHLTGGALAGTAALSAPNSLTSSAVLANVTGSLTATGGGMSVSAVGSAGPVFLVDGGSVSVSYTGSLTGVAATPLLRVANGHSGTLAFNGTNSMITTGSPGLRFENADGTYNLNVTAGTTALSGDSAGIDILAGNDPTNGSQGTFQFGAPGNGFAITSGAGTAFNFQGSAADVTFHGGITKNAAQTGRMVDITGQKAASAITFQTGTLSATSSNAASTGILLNDADGQVAFNGTTTLNGGDAGIDVENGSGGTITFAGTSSVVNAAGELIRIMSSAPMFTYSGAFQRTTGNAVGILAQNNTGGTITFNGDGTTLDGDAADVTKSLSTGTANAVSLLTNTGTTIQFAGGMTLAATSGAGMNATGGGTVTLTGAGNTVNTTGGGTAVNVQNTSIGAGGVNLLSVNASGGGANGIVLQNAGSGGFQVTGDGASDTGNTTRGRTTAKSGGGTVALGSGGTITGKTGDAVSLSSTGAVTLRNLVVQNGGGDAIDAASVGGLTIDNTRVASNPAGFGLYAQTTSGVQVIHSEFVGNATNAGLETSDTWNLRWHNVTGTSSVESSVLQNAREHVWGVFNNTGTLTLTASNSNILGAAAGNGVLLDVAGSGNVTSSFQNDSIAGHFSTGILAGTQATTGATMGVTVNNSAFTDEFAGVAVAHGSSGPTSFSITNNRFQRHGSVVININRLGADAFGFTAFGLFQGTVSGNTIGTAGVANSGSDAGDGIDVKTNGNGGITRVAVLNNTIREYGQHGIALLPRDATTGHTLEARVQGNNIANGEAVVSLDGINTTLGALNTDQVTACLNISGNTVASAVRNGVRVRSSGLPAPNVTLRLHGWDGATAPATYFANNNPAATGAGGNTSFSNANGTNTSATCTTP